MLLSETAEISRNLKNLWTLPLKIVNLLIFIDNRKESLRLLNFCDFYLQFCKIWKISEYKNTNFSEIIRNFAKVIKNSRNTTFKNWPICYRNFKTNRFRVSVQTIEETLFVSLYHLKNKVAIILKCCFSYWAHYCKWEKIFFLGIFSSSKTW